MARTRGIFNFSANLEVKKNAPLDARIVVDTILELTQTSTWEDSDNKVWLYNGIVVSVLENNGLYMLTNYDPVSAATAYSEADNWVRIDASAASIPVINDLTTGGATSALSAEMGKTLNQSIQSINSKLSAIYTYKGSVDTYEQLPTENQQVGDTYNVVAAHDTIPAGTNYAWNGTDWDPLGGSVDLSNYYTKTQTDDQISQKVGEVSGDLNTLITQVESNTAALTIINGTEETSGSLANTLKTAKTYTDTQLLNYVQKVEGSSLITEEKLQLIDTNASDIAELEARVEANEAALQILNGEETVTNSVKYTVNQSITTALTWNEL